MSTTPWGTTSTRVRKVADTLCYKLCALKRIFSCLTENISGNASLWSAASLPVRSLTYAGSESENTSFILCMHLSVWSRDFRVTKRRNYGETPHSASNSRNPKRHTPIRTGVPRERTNNARTGAHKQGPKQPAMTRNTQRALEQRESSNTYSTKQP